MTTKEVETNALKIAYASQYIPEPAVPDFIENEIQFIRKKTFFLVKQINALKKSNGSSFLHINDLRIDNHGNLFLGDN